MAESAVLDPAAHLKYYCHSCRHEIQPNLPAYTCPDCSDGFVEALDEQSSSSSSSDDNNGAEEHETVVNQLFPFDFLFGALPNLQQTHRRTRQQQQQVPPAWPAQFDLLHEIFAGLNGGGGRLYSQSGDYVIGGAAALDAVITQLMNQLDSHRAQPATDEDIALLPELHIDAKYISRGKSLQCNICMDDYSVGDGVLKLPCLHIYHTDCILPWIREQGTCPICRKNMSGLANRRDEVPSADLGDTSSSATAPVGGRSARATASDDSMDYEDAQDTTTENISNNNRRTERSTSSQNQSSRNHINYESLSSNRMEDDYEDF